MEEEEIFERRERALHRFLDRARPWIERARRIPRPTRGTIAVVVLAVLMADLAVVGSRNVNRVVPASPLGDTATASAPALEAAKTLEGSGPLVVFAVEVAGNDRVRIYASDLGSPEFTKTYLGEYPGFIADYAGSQGQAAGKVVPINTFEETTDATRATRLWLMKRGNTARSVLSTFDFVSAYALDAGGDAIALSRRSVLSPARGSFLWLYPLDPPAARQVGSLRRPGGSGPASALRPVAWGPRNATIYATPFCDQCGDDTERGLFVVSLPAGTMSKLPLTGEHNVTDPSFSADGSRFVFQEAERIGPCKLFERCEERHLYAADVAAGRLREIARSRELSFDSPVLSPDGKVIAYASGRGNEIVWRSFDTGEVIGAVNDAPSEELFPVAWIDSRRLLVSGRTSSARADGPSEGNLFLISRLMLNDGTESGARLDLVASDNTIQFLGWLS